MCSDLKTLAITIFYWGMFIIYAYFLKCLCCFSISSFSSWQSHTWIIPHINPVPGSLTTTRYVEAVYSAGAREVVIRACLCPWLVGTGDEGQGARCGLFHRALWPGEEENSVSLNLFSSVLMQGYQFFPTSPGCKKIKQPFWLGGENKVREYIWKTL